MNEFVFVGLIFFGAVTSLFGVYMGAYLQNYNTQRELLREHCRMTMDLMSEVNKKVRK